MNVPSSNLQPPDLPLNPLILLPLPLKKFAVTIYATKLRNYWPETGDSQEEVIRKSERRKNAEDIASAQSPKGANQNLVQPKIINSFVKKGKTIHQGEDGKYYEEY